MIFIQIMLYDFDNYKMFLRHYIRTKPRSGRGILSRLAASMDMTSAQMSHVMQGERDLTLEQGLKAAEYVGLTTVEADYFIELIIHSRAGSKTLKDFSKRRLSALKGQGLQLKNQVPEHRVLTEAQMARFYSSWIYSGIRLFCSIRPMQVEDIMDNFHLDRSRANDIVQFLEEARLIIASDKGYIMGQQSTFVARNSPFVFKHHANWRRRALDQAENNLENDLFFTSPVSLSEKDFEKLKHKITDFIKEFSATVKVSPAETVACLNIDFFYL